MEELEDMEEDAGLGNGGLGRLAGEQLFMVDEFKEICPPPTDLNNSLPGVDLFFLPAVSVF